MLTSSLVRHNRSAFGVLSERIVSWRTAKGQFPGHTLSPVLTQPHVPISASESSNHTDCCCTHYCVLKVLLVHSSMKVDLDKSLV